MKYVNCEALSGPELVDKNGEQIDASQLISASFHFHSTDDEAEGTFKLQVSNDICRQGYNPDNFIVSNWVDLPNQSVAVESTDGDQILTVAQMSYRWIRAVWDATPAAASLVLQDLTYTAAGVGSAGNSITIRYLDDGTGGAETVSVVGNAITVHMEDGVSTATEILTAVQASAPASALVSVVVSGTGSDPQTAVAATPLVGGAGGDGDISVKLFAVSI